MDDVATAAEIEFLRGLGSWSMAGERTSRRILLEKYLLASSRRVNWDSIDQGRVVAFAAEEIKKGGVVDGTDAISG